MKEKIPTLTFKEAATKLENKDQNELKYIEFYKPDYTIYKANDINELSKDYIILKEADSSAYFSNNPNPLYIMLPKESTDQRKLAFSSEILSWMAVIDSETPSLTTLRPIKYLYSKIFSADRELNPGLTSGELIKAIFTHDGIQELLDSIKKYETIDFKIKPDRFEKFLKDLGEEFELYYKLL